MASVILTQVSSTQISLEQNRVLSFQLPAQVICRRYSTFCTTNVKLDTLSMLPPPRANIRTKARIRFAIVYLRPQKFDFAQKSLHSPFDRHVSNLIFNRYHCNDFTISIALLLSSLDGVVFLSCDAQCRVHCLWRNSRRSVATT
jgi:hypothetical protein